MSALSDTQNETDEPAEPVKPARFSLTRLWPLAVIVLALVAGYAAGLHRYFSLDSIIMEHEALQAWVRGNTVVAAFSYTLLYVVAVAVSFPGASFLTIAGGLLFGVFLGSLLTVLGATAGASIIFLVAKTSLGAPLRARAGAFTRKLAQGFENNAFSYLLSLRLQPIFPFWLINVAPALFNVPLTTYAIATALGIIPGVIAYSLLGDGLGAVIAAQEAANPGCAQAGTCEIDLQALVSPLLIAALLAMSLVALLPMMVGKLRRKAHKP
ncbi:MAG: TVP38/TMEM64 family protein [Pseudomonadota bacterium]